ncbi:MAG: sodium-dependent transporter, partial [Alphaproteobacteria bacterium]
GTPWPAVGAIGLLGASLILSYYAVVTGWAAKYLAAAATGALWAEAGADYGAFFRGFITGSWEPVSWHLAVVAVTAAVVASGVRRGVERTNKVLMPLLAVIVLGLAGHGLTLEGAGRALAFLFEPTWDALLDPRVYLAAMGQAFFSIGVGAAIFITYGAYLAGEERIASAAAWVVTGDTAIAVLAGLAVFPAVFTFGVDPASGPELAFVVLPRVFRSIAGGEVLGVLFFLLLVMAALTSTVAMLEAAVAYVMRRLGLVVVLAGLPPALGYGLLRGVAWRGRGILETMDVAAANVLLPIGALGVALFVGWRWGKGEAVAQSGLGQGALGRAWFWLLRVVAPALILAVMLTGLRAL